MNYFLKMFTGNPITMLWVALAVFAAGTAVGGSAAWTLNGWRLGTQVEHEKALLATCDGSLARTQDANKAFAVSFGHQGDAIRELAADGKARDDKIDKAAAESKKQGTVLLGKADEILKRPLPATAAEDCGALSVDLDEVIRERRGR